MKMSRMYSITVLSLVTGTLLTTLLACGGGSGGTTGSNPNSSTAPPLTSQIQDITNWQVYQGKDNTSTDLLASSSIWRKVLLALNRLPSISTKAVALDLTGITTYSSNGLVAPVMTTLYMDDRFVMTGSPDTGYSIFNLSDALSPRGRIVNSRGTPSNNELNNGTFGYMGAAKNGSDGLIYAWFGQDIIQVNTGTVVSSQAPHFGGTQSGGVPKDRMVFDNQGRLWIGAVNLEHDGTPLNYQPAMNGLYRYSADFSTRETILNETIAVWNLYKDATGTLWASTNGGVYRFAPDDQPVVVWDLSSQSKYADQIFEFNGSIYASVKNYFHNPNIPLIIFDLYKWDGATFNFVSNAFTSTFYYNSSPFVWRGELYFTFGGARKFNGSDAFVETNFGQMGQIAKVYGDVIASVGGIEGLFLYNLNNNSQMTRLTASNTAEGLILNLLYCLYSGSNDELYIGAIASGFNLFTPSNEQFTIFGPTESQVKGFSRYSNRLYISDYWKTYYLENESVTFLIDFPLGFSGRTYQDRNILWGIFDDGDRDGKISYIDLQTEIRNEDLQFDQTYHFNSVIKIPNENAVLIGVGKKDIQNEYPIPYALKYHYETGSFEKILLPDADSVGIYSFCVSENNIYGISKRKIYRYQDGAWEFFASIQSNNYITSSQTAGGYLFITSWNSYGGLEVVNLATRSSNFFDTRNSGLPSNSVQDLLIQNIGGNDYRLWFATMNGLAECVVTLAAE